MLCLLTVQRYYMIVPGKLPLTHEPFVSEKDKKTFRFDNSFATC